MAPTVKIQGDEVIITFASEQTFISILLPREDGKILAQRLINHLGLPWETKKRSDEGEGGQE